MSDVLAAIEGSALAVYLRNSVWAYPIVNAGHIVGVALLVGSSVPLGLRFLGLWKSVPQDDLRYVLNRIADAGFAIASVCGLLLFGSRAVSYAESAVFAAKMAVLVTAMLITASLRILTAGRRKESKAEPSLSIRVAAGASIIAWLAVLTLGRLIGYF